jgi:hypothetical protein
VTAAREYRRIGPHPSNAPGAVIAVETPRAAGGTHYAEARLTHTLPPAALDCAFAVLETDLEQSLNDDPRGSNAP